MTKYHTPVLFQESIEGLSLQENGCYVDVTFGGGGHSHGILKAEESARLIAFDQDPDSHENEIVSDRFTLVKQNFRYLKNNLRMLGANPIDGLLADLGVSSYQFDIPDRGFSTRFDGPLDMRMNPQQTGSAADILNSKTQEELTTIFRLYGEINNAWKLAGAIVMERELVKFKTTDQLKAIAKQFTPEKKINQYLAQVFQALRIEVNNELEALKELLIQSTDVLKPNGRLVFISYHSLEDRLVKNFFRTGNFEGTPEKDFYGNLIRPLEPVNRKVITPSEEELKQNTRSRSAKLRIAKKR
jgi:16S rRNA (cytosine1402-N4)-methyltransferase|tara:strand:- start:449 stop:1348 length:900 start_codon:yes stop_codon:yes gene_type:complete